MGAGENVLGARLRRALRGRLGALTLATLLRVARYFASDHLSDAAGSEPAAASVPPELALPIEVVGTQTFVVAKDSVVALVGLGRALHHWQQRAQQPPPADAWSMEASDALAAFWDSPRPRERWISAAWLGRLRDRRALPALTRLLTEYLPPHEVCYDNGSPVCFYDVSSRPDLVPLIWHLREAGGEVVGELAVALRQALVAALAVEQAIPRPSGPDLEWYMPELGGQRREHTPAPYRWTGQEAVQMYHSECQPWIEYQHEVVYGLGWLGVFGALMGVPTPEGIYNFGATWVGPADDPSNRAIINAEAEDHADRFRGNLWRVQACCGYLEHQYCARVDPRVSFEHVPAFADAVAHLLEEQFGLTEAERRQAMTDYAKAGYLYDVMDYYQHVARERAHRQQRAGAMEASSERPADGDQPPSG